jgi:hypothetical protein
MIYRYLQAAVPIFVVPLSSHMRHVQRSLRYVPAFFTLFRKIRTLLALLFDQNNISEENTI